MATQGLVSRHTGRVNPLMSERGAEGGDASVATQGLVSERTGRVNPLMSERSGGAGGRPVGPVPGGYKDRIKGLRQEPGGRWRGILWVNGKNLYTETFATQWAAAMAHTELCRLHKLQGRCNNVDAVNALKPPGA